MAHLNNKIPSFWESKMLYFCISNCIQGLFPAVSEGVTPCAQGLCGAENQTQASNTQSM